MIKKKKKKINKKSTKNSYKIDPEIILDVKDLSKTYTLGADTTVALDKVNIKIKKGELVAVVGPSGSGKTTLINSLGALGNPDSGKIIYNMDGQGNGEDITEMSDLEQKYVRLDKIGLIFQFYNLFPVLTAFENCELPMLIGKVPAKEREKRVERLLKMVGLGERMIHYPTQMSGGEQQRVTVARALVNDPLIILADEPTGELDTETTTQIMKIFLELRTSGRSILMVTHNEAIAEAADRIITLTDGKIMGERQGGKPIEDIYKT